jgi:hypothetical protein
VPGRQLDRLLVPVVRQADDDCVGLGVGDRLLEVRRPLLDALLARE